MRLPVKLTPDDLALRAQELADAEATLADAEVRLDAFVEAAKGTRKGIETEIADARAEVGRLARVVRDKAEAREVPTMEDPDFENGTVKVFRTDTSELVATRVMGHEERQRSMFERDREPS